ncbi:MAG: A24 family peptidase [Pseudomonadota bacterium]
MTDTATAALAALPVNLSVAVLVLLLGLAAWTDWRTMRIPNWLTVPGMAWGLYFSAIHGVSVGAGLLSGALGLATGLLMLLPLFALRVLGAGDVKLMAMVGAFLGALATFKALLVIGIVGGVAALLFAVSHRALGQLAVNARDIVQSAALPGVGLWRPGVSGPSIGKLPYGISIALGTVVFLVLRQLGFA